MARRKAKVGGKKQDGGKPTPKQVPGPRTPRGALSVGDRRFARLLNDPCNAPYAPGMIANGHGTNVQRFCGDYVISSGATGSNVNFCVSPNVMGIFAGSTATDNDPISWNSSNLFPGAGAMSGWIRFRCLAACIQVTWVNSEQNRKGYIAMGNAPRHAAVTGASCTPGELRAALPYGGRMPAESVGIKWRPNQTDLDMNVAGSEINLQTSAIYAQVSAIDANTQIRFRVTAVMEWEMSPAFGGGYVIPQYSDTTDETSDGDRFIRAMRWLDKTGHWLLDNGVALGHAANKALALLA